MTNTSKDVVPFMEGNSTKEIAERVVSDIFEYDLSKFVLVSVDTSDNGSKNGIISEDQQSREQVVSDGGEKTFTWSEIVGPGEYQTIIELDLQPSVHQMQSDSLYQEMPGAEIIRFEAYHELEDLSPAALSDHHLAFFIFGIV